jgi:hypothetical protein
MTSRPLVLALVTVSGAVASSQQTVKFTPTAGVQTFAVREPVLRITPGTTVETNTFQVASQVGEVRVADIVDPNYTVIAKFPKKLLPPRR